MFGGSFLRLSYRTAFSPRYNFLASGEHTRGRVKSFASNAAILNDTVSLSLAQNLDELETLGFTVVTDVFTPEEIAMIQADYVSIQAKAADILASEAPKPRVWMESGKVTESRYWKQGKGTDGHLILQAGEGRFDLWRGFNEGFFDSKLLAQNPKLRHIMDHCLVENYTHYSGVIQSNPGSQDQYYHRDTDTLSNRDSNGDGLMAVDDFYFTCLIPVSHDTTPENGPTQFLVGSHRAPASEFDGLETAKVCVPLGSAVVFNGKLNHKGCGNRSEKERSVMYTVFHKRWYNDNFRMGVDDS